jgi:solute carrier family 34 (sodium-dependent phosphate cotransporter)
MGTRFSSSDQVSVAREPNRLKKLPLLGGRGVAALALLVAFLLGIRAMSTGFQGLTVDFAGDIFRQVSNPPTGFAVGLLATALVQSSSLSTSMIVALVAVPGAGRLPVESAIPMVIGANIGTTVTNSLVALAYVGRKEAFHRAFATATAHDFFNILLAAVLLPLEMMTGLLATASRITAHAVHGFGAGIRLSNPVGAAVGACVEPLRQALLEVMPPTSAHATLLAASAACIYVCLMLLIRVTQAGTVDRIRAFVLRALEGPRIKNVTIGAVLTGIVQSSSVTTSVLIPLSAARLIRLQHALELTIGANLGTTGTALIAALAAPPQTATVATQIALVHFYFNLIGVALLLPKSRFWNLPLDLSIRYANVAVRSRKLVLGHILLLYFLLPTLVILAWRGR